MKQLELFPLDVSAKPTRKRRAKLKAVPPSEAPPVIEVPEAPATAELIAFPASRFAARIRALAAKLRGLLEEEDRNDAWRVELKRIRIEMLRTGIPPEVVKVEMQEFAEAVRAEYWRPVKDQPSSRPTHSGA